LRVIVFGVETVRVFEFYLNKEAHPGSSYSHPINPHCEIYWFLKEGAAEIAAWCVCGGKNLSF
jgi:hypothetical protein